MLESYDKMKNQGYEDDLEIIIENDDKVYNVEFFDGVRLDPKTIPSGKHLYHTRHDDYGNWSEPVTIAQEGCQIMVNFCGSIVSDEPFNLTDETDLTYVSFV